MNSNISIADQIDQMEVELKRLRGLAHAEAEARRQSVTPEYVYTITPVVGDSFDRIYDESVTKFRIEGVCTNQEAVDAVGGKTHTGGMNYMFNWASGKIIGAFGGGSIFISGRGWEKDSPEIVATFDKLSSFIVTNPDGGDITEIVEAHRASVA